MFTANDLMEHVMKMCPNATIDEDNDGQIVIYTNLIMISSDEHLIDMDEDR